MTLAFKVALNANTIIQPIRSICSFADDFFKFDENRRKSLKRVENTVGKGKIARYEQFLLFPQCFQKTCTVDKSLFWEGLILLNDDILEAFGCNTTSDWLNRTV